MCKHSEDVIMEYKEWGLSEVREAVERHLERGTGKVVHW